MFPLPEFVLSIADAQKNRDIQKRTAKKICTVSQSLEKVAAIPVKRWGSFPGGEGGGLRLDRRIQRLGFKGAPGNGRWR